MVILSFIGIWEDSWEEYLKETGKKDTSNIVRGVSLPPEDVSRLKRPV
jgi:hypothetical protein